MNKPYFYYLPDNLIANTPSTPRDHSKLLQINRLTGKLFHHHFYDLPDLLNPTDVLVFNNTKVFPARLHGVKTTGGKVEVLLLKKLENDLWHVISHPGIKPGQIINFSSEVSAQVVTDHSLKLSAGSFQTLSKIGHTPLPPYIHSSQKEAVLRKQYQTVYAKSQGSAAAPTAGLHFTNRLLGQLEDRHIQTEFLTLHVGLGTFKPPTPDQLASGHLHSEWFTLSSQTAARLNLAKSQGRRIIAVGTTTTRVLESCADTSGLLTPQSGETDIFIKPPYKFKFVDGLITNFHLPGSSLIMLVSAFSSWEIIQKAYQQAIAKNYRFYSFGDACLIT